MKTEKTYLVLRSPHVSEKATLLQTSENQYVFKVSSDATKADVKASVEAMFGVKVDAVRVLNVKGKAKAFRARQGLRQGFRKAYVSLAQGQSIDFGAKA